MAERDETRDVWLDNEYGDLDRIAQGEIGDVFTRPREYPHSVRYCPYSDLLAAEARVMELEEERDQVREELSLLSSKLGNGLGDDSRSTASYVGAIDDGIERILRVELQRLSDAQKRITELAPLAAAYREIGEARAAYIEAQDNHPEDDDWQEERKARKRQDELLDRAAEHAKGESRG